MTENPPCTCALWVAYFKELHFTRVCHFAKYRISKHATVWKYMWKTDITRPAE